MSSINFWPNKFEYSMSKVINPQGEDIILWPDLTWCFRDELEAYSHMSDDYSVVPFESDGYYACLKLLS